MDKRTAPEPDAVHEDVDGGDYRRLIDASPVPIAVVDPDRTVRQWNAAAARLFGWTAADVVGRPIPIVPEANLGCHAEGTAFPRSEPSIALTTSRLTKDGTLVDVAVVGVPLAGSGGGAGRMMLVFQDVRDRPEAGTHREDARREAEDVRVRFAFLARASEVLASSLDYETTLEHVARLAVPVLADYCVIDVMSDDGELRRVAAAHADPAKDHLVQQLRAIAPTPYMTARVSRVLATGEPDVVADLDLERAIAGLPDETRRQLVRSLAPRSYIVVALRARGASVGTMTFAFAESGRSHHRTDVALAQELARRAAVALDNARLHSAEQRARAAAESAERRAAFLADASAVLASSLDHETTLRSVAELAVPFLADWCTVDIVDDDGSVRRLAIVQADASKADLARMASTYPPDPDGRHPRTRVLRTGRPVLISAIADDALAGIANDADQLSALRALGYRSAMIVPLTVRGRVLGALSLATAASARRYDPDHLALAEQLAHRAAVALDNARLFQAERDAHAEAQAASRAKDEFLSTVSHELRTPLQAMLGWVAVLRQGKLPEPKRARALDIIEQSGRAQDRLIGDLLDVSRMVSGRLRLDPQPVTLLPLIQAAVDAVQPAADAKQVHVRCLFDPRVGVVAGDPDRLRQVIWNLLSNAVKFTPAGGRVELRLEHHDGEVRIVVTDSGEGIAPSFLPFIFERFRQAEYVRRTRPRSGVGLGLAIVRHLVELHGGRALVESPGPGLGATFTVVLPSPPLAAQPSVTHAEVQRPRR